MRCLKNLSLVAINCAALPSLCLFVLCALHYDVCDAHHLKARHFFGRMDVGPKTGSRSQETYDICLVVGQHFYIRHKVYALL